MGQVSCSGWSTFVHSVSVDEVPVEVPAEPRTVAQDEAAFLQGRPVVDQLPPERVTVRVEAFDERAVRLAGDEVACDLRFFVMGHLYVVGAGDGRRPAPRRRTARPRSVE